MIRSQPEVEVLRIHHDGRVIWRGREVETDDDFRAAMRDMAESMREVACHRVCPACGSDV